MARRRVAVVGGSGYTGGELLRLLVQHPHAEVAAVTSRRQAGKPVARVHPHLRGVDLPKFSPPDAVPEVDVLFSCLPHGASLEAFASYAALAPKVIDLSSDFRLRAPEDYARWYGHVHPDPEALARFVYGMPELHREAIRQADYVAAPGCTATAAILPLWPLVRRFEVSHVVIDAKVGSSAGGAAVSQATHHPERSRVVRSFKPSGHRHTAEMIQELGLPPAAVHFSPHAVELVRGILATCHVFVAQEFEEKDVWQAYLQAYGDEPFVRLVKERAGLYRFPEPKLVAGTNLCDIGFEKDEATGRLVVMAAIDNLMKGAAGQAVQCFNLMCGFAETAGLQALPLHPN